MKKILFAILISMGLASTVNASELNYDHVKVGVTYYDTFSATGLAVESSASLTENVYVVADLSATDLEYNLTGWQGKLGVGGHLPVNSTTDVYATVYGAYGSVVYDWDTRILDSWGYGAETGVYTKFNDFSVRVGVSYDRYTLINTGDLFANVEVAYDFSDSFSGTLDVKNDFGRDNQLMLGVRYNF